MRSPSLIGLVLAAAGCAGLFDVDELPAEVDAGSTPDAGDDADGSGDPCALPDCFPEAGCADTACVQEMFGDSLCRTCMDDGTAILDCSVFGDTLCEQIEPIVDGADYHFTAPASVQRHDCSCCEEDVVLPAAGTPIAGRAGNGPKPIVSFLFPPNDGPKLVAMKLDWIDGDLGGLVVTAKMGEVNCELAVPNQDACNVKDGSVLLRFNGMPNPPLFQNQCDPVPVEPIRQLTLGINGGDEAFVNLRSIAIVELD